MDDYGGELGDEFNTLQTSIHKNLGKCTYMIKFG
jgi:hypothetical protein